MIATLALAFQVAAGVPEVVQRARVNPAQGVNFAAAIVPETVIVGQQAVYQVAVFVSDEVRQRLRRNPEFVPPELRAVLAYDPPGGYTRYPNVRLAGRDWEAHVFQRVVFPLARGRVEIPPARLSYALPLSSSFFSREETYTVRSPSVTLEAVDPPTVGRPADWDGAVGRLTMRARLEPTRVRAGDPVTVTLQVAGAANVNLLPRPRLVVPWGDAVPAGERVTLDSVRLRVAGTKEFDWVVTPARAGRQELPAQRYPVFDPATGRYEIVMSTPERLDVTSGVAIAGEPSGTAPEGTSDDSRLPVRDRWTGERPAPPWRQWPFWLLVALAPAPAVGRWRQRRVRLRVAAGPGAPRLPLASETKRREATPGTDTPSLRYERWHEFLRGLVDVPVGTDAGGLRRSLRRAGITDATADRAVSLDDALARQAFGPARRRPDASVAGALADEMAALERDLIRERASGASASRGRRGSTRPLLLVMAGGLTIGRLTQALPEDRARARFDAGVAAYREGRLDEARRAFADAAAQAPRAPDAWANVGTAAHAALDTGVAVMGWQRALRLDPTAADVRDRLEALPGMTGSVLSPVTVWPVSADGLALLALGGWVLGWGALAFSAAWARRLAVGGLAIGLAGAAASGAAAVRAAADTLFVVAKGDRLRVLPALGGDPVAAATAGELVESLERQGAWRRVRMLDGREGWIEDRALLGLAQPR